MNAQVGDGQPGRESAGHAHGAECVPHRFRPYGFLGSGGGRDTHQNGSESGRPIEYWLALIELGFGNREGALALLEQAYPRRGRSMPYIGVDPRLEVLRDEPRFVALKKRLRLG